MPRESPIPAFRADGYLPEGVHPAPEADILFRFGSSSRQRRRLALRLRRYARGRRPAQRACGGRAVITNSAEYNKAREELRALEHRLERLQRDHPIGTKGFTKAGVRKMIARLHEELAVYEGGEDSRQPLPS